MAFDDYEALLTYLTENARAGDHIAVWSLWPFMPTRHRLHRGNVQQMMEQFREKGLIDEVVDMCCSEPGRHALRLRFTRPRAGSLSFGR